MRSVVGWCSCRLVAVGVAGAMIAAPTSQIIAAPESLKNFVVHERPKPPPAINFQDELGKTANVADLKGKFVVLNLWANVPNWVPRAATHARASSGSRLSLASATMPSSWSTPLRPTGVTMPNSAR